MKMTTKSNKHGTGIYVQESADVTTAGDGLGPQGYRSPVAPYDNTLIRSQLDDAQNSEKNTSYKRSSFNASRTELSSVIEGGCESDTKDVKPHRNNTFRIQRNQQMTDEFRKLGFSNGEIHAMQVGLEIERRNRHRQNKMIRYCDETNLDLKSARQTWLERKEREIAKYRAEKAAKIAAGTFNPIPFRERKGKRDKNKDRERGRDTNRDTEQDKEQAGEMSSHGTINHCNSTEFFMPESLDQYEAFNNKDREPFEKKQIFTGPAILAGAKEDDSPYSVKNRRKVIMRMKQMAFARVNKFEEARQRMGLRGRHISLKSCSSDSKPKFQDSPYSPDKRKASTYENVLARQSLSDIKANYPIEVQILDKSHPFGEIRQENHFLLLDALETTIQDERVLGAHWINIGPAQYKKMRLHVSCKNIGTVKFLQGKVPLYNRLWREADLFVTTEKVIYRRYKYKVNLEHYNLTSDEFFKIIKKQNGYPTEYWVFCHKYEGANDVNNFRGWFVVDVESHRRLEESEGFVHFLFERIQLSLFSD